MKRPLSTFLVAAMIQLILSSPSFAGEIHLAAMIGQTEAVIRLISEGADVDAIDASFLGLTRTPLHYAARAGHIETVQALITAGAHVNLTDNFRRSTPLLDAAEAGSLAMVQALIAAGANVNAFDEYRKTPLHYAVEGGNLKIVQTLIAAGADVNAFDEHRKTPLQGASIWHRAAMTAALQPEAIGQIHTHEALRRSELEEYALAGDSYTLAAESFVLAAETVPRTAEAEARYLSAANSYHLAGRNYSHAGQLEYASNSHRIAAHLYSTLDKDRAAIQSNHLAGISYTQVADSYSVERDYTAAIKNYDLAHQAYLAAGDLEAAALNRTLGTILTLEITAQGHVEAMENHFAIALTHSEEARAQLARGEAGASDDQAQAELVLAQSREAAAVAAYETAAKDVDGALETVMNTHAAAIAAGNPVAQLDQVAASVGLLRAHAVRIHAQIDQIRANATAGHERYRIARHEGE